MRYVDAVKLKSFIRCVLLFVIPYLVAHDTNIAMVRTLMGFSWTLPGYTRGNIPPGSSLVIERWRDTRSGERFLHVYFQGQSLDDLRNPQAVNREHPLLREEWRQADCRITEE